MTLARSLVFQLLFYSWTAFLAIVCLPVLVMPPTAIAAISRLWSRTNFFLLRTVNGLAYRIEGMENIAGRPIIYASKHQSAWDTMVFPMLLPRPAVVLKRELQLIPFYGWYAKKYGTIGIDRKAGATALRSMVRDARQAIANGQPIVVFPEGTRTAPGERLTYQSGVAALYTSLGVPVVPVALNSGLFWSRRSILRKPGTITLRFLPAIPPGLKRGEFMTRLETAIEAAQAELIGEATGPTEKPPSRRSAV
jgi:1-acyl-sn-glycerol-3-phosphate acyltransferase